MVADKFAGENVIECMELVNESDTMYANLGKARKRLTFQKNQGHDFHFGRFIQAEDEYKLQDDRGRLNENITHTIAVFRVADGRSFVHRYGNIKDGDDELDTVDRLPAGYDSVCLKFVSEEELKKEQLKKKKKAS